MSDGTNELYCYTHSSDKNNHCTLIEEHKVDRDSYYEKGRKRIHPNHTDYTGVIGQIITEFDEDGILK